MNGLKEWATVVKALENGKQTVILRKGGILETASGFEIESKKFLLFPTWEHQEIKHVKSEYHDFLNQTLNHKPREGYNIITSIAEVLDHRDISSNNIIDDLSSFHVWSNEYIKERINWMPEKPLKAIFLKVYTFPQIEIPLQSDFEGCKSWIELNSNQNSGQSVLTNQEINNELKKFREIVN
jgi:hypothetical protein|tara:strand:- start:80 stop:625 length:546 start_codon:yes stop_codon:yes gene_type:complete